jgi:hypothetical protein
MHQPVGRRLSAMHTKNFTVHKTLHFQYILNSAYYIFMQKRFPQLTRNPSRPIFKRI